MACVTEVKREYEDGLDEISREDDLDDISEKIMYPKIELKVKKESKQSDFICYVCGKSFGNKGDLNKHISRIHEAVAGSKFCDQCTKSFKNNGDLYHHKAQVHTSEILNCGKCNVDCKNKNALRKHMAKCIKRDVPLPLISCTFCAQTFSIHRSLYKHLKQQHNQQVTESECDVCGKLFDIPSKLDRHKKRAHKTPSKTEENNGGLSTENRMYNFYNEDPGDIPVVEERTQDYAQRDEGKVIESLAWSQAGALEIPFACPQFGTLEVPSRGDTYDFYSESGTPTNPRNEILDNVKTDLPIVISECKSVAECIDADIDEEETLFVENSAKIKLEEETNVIPDQEVDDAHSQHEFKSVPKSEFSTQNLCDICARLFANKSSLKKHMMTAHMKEDDSAVCEICSKTFRAKHLLQYHTREVHSNQLFSCEVCGKTFGSKSYLKRHLERHRTENIFACQLCEKSFSTKGYLRHHHKAVHILEDNPCEKCGKMYKNKYLLRKHINKYHITR